MSSDIPIEVHIVHDKVDVVSGETRIVPLTNAVDNSVIGTAQVGENGIVRAMITDPDMARKVTPMFGPGVVSLRDLTVDDGSTAVPSSIFSGASVASMSGAAIHEVFGAKPVPKNVEGYTDGTLLKVRDALHKVGLNETQITHAIGEMQNHGILFRERK